MLNAWTLFTLPEGALMYYNFLTMGATCSMLGRFLPAGVSINVLQFPYHGSHMLNAWTLFILPE